MTTMRSLLLMLSVAVFLLFSPCLSTALVMMGLEDYCCVCGPCEPGAALKCIPALTPGTVEADCANRCNHVSCQFIEVLDGTCNANAGACMPSPAPAASHELLFGLGVLLLGGGVALVRRRVAH